jgi:biotin transport system substrate-specific component
MTMIDLQARHDTLANSLWPSQGHLAEMGGLLRATLLAVVGSLFLVACAKIQVPFYPVPLTMGTFGILTVGMVFGWRQFWADI